MALVEDHRGDVLGGAGQGCPPLQPASRIDRARSPPGEGDVGQEGAAFGLQTGANKRAIDLAMKRCQRLDRRDPSDCSPLTESTLAEEQRRATMSLRRLR